MPPRHRYRSECGGKPGAFCLINAFGAAGTDPTIEQTTTGLIVGAAYEATGDQASRSRPNVVSFAVEVASNANGPWTTVYSKTPTALGV